MSFPRERDPGTGTKNEVVTNWQHSVMRIQVNKNPSMTAQQLHNKCVSLQNLSIRTIQRCLTVLLHKKHRFLLFGAYCICISLILEFRLFGYYSFLATKIQVYLQFPLSQLSQSKLRTHTNDWKTVSWLCKIKPIKSFILPGKQSQQIESTFLKYSLFNNVKLTESQT